MSAVHNVLAGLNVPVTRLVTDSRAIQPGDVFVACPGERTDGRHYIAQAIAQGASAVLWDTQEFDWKPEWRVPNLGIANLRDQIGDIADQVYGMPSERLWMVGVTGTNGKTSISHWLARAFTLLHRKCALIGTLGNGFPGELSATVNTTPDAVSVHRLLAEYDKQGAKAVAMEVSSHALAQGRVNGVRYDVALLTNLSRDHLDYHGDMQRYAAAKRRLFDWDGLRHAVLNLDDEYGATLAQELREAKVEVVGYGLTPAAASLAAQLDIRMVFGAGLVMAASGLEMQVQSAWGSAVLQSRLIGRFNASNLLGALAVLLVSGFELEEAVQALAQQKAVNGRMQTMGGNGQPMVVVDYAHTPDALEKVLIALREIKGDSGKLICVFGCGGDRDRGKRPMMGTVASKFADVRIVTSDNPRTEPPKAIIDAIAMGMSGDYVVIEDRAQAIARSIAQANVGDVVLLAGKGHEEYQEINGVKHPFSDSELAHRALSMWAPEPSHQEWVTT